MMVHLIDIHLFVRVMLNRNVALLEDFFLLGVEITLILPRIWVFCVRVNVGPWQC